MIVGFAGYTENVLKFEHIFIFGLILNESLVIRTCKNNKQGRPWPDCFFQKQSALDLAYLSTPFRKTTCVQNFGTFPY